MIFDYGVALVIAIFIAYKTQPRIEGLFKRQSTEQDTFGDAIANLLIEGFGVLFAFLAFFLIGVFGTIALGRLFNAALSRLTIRGLRRESPILDPDLDEAAPSEGRPLDPDS